MNLVFTAKSIWEGISFVVEKPGEEKYLSCGKLIR